MLGLSHKAAAGPLCSGWLGSWLFSDPRSSDDEDEGGKITKTHLLPSHQVTGTQVRTISPKNISNLPMSRGTGSLWGSRPRDRGSECILLLWRIL